MVPLLTNVGPYSLVNLKYSFDYTDLHIAARQGHHALAQLLLEKGADSSLVDTNGEISIHMAVW